MKSLQFPFVTVGQFRVLDHCSSNDHASPGEMLLAADSSSTKRATSGGTNTPPYADRKLLFKSSRFIGAGRLTKNWFWVPLILARCWQAGRRVSNGKCCWFLTVLAQHRSAGAWWRHR